MNPLSFFAKWPEAQPPAPVVPVRPEFPCGVPDCFELPLTVEADDRITVVECVVHDARTHWPTTKPEVKEQTIIRVQDGWRQHGSSQPPKQKG